MGRRFLANGTVNYGVQKVNRYIEWVTSLDRLVSLIIDQ